MPPSNPQERVKIIASIKTDPQTHRDLSGADLSGADLSDADLSGANLRYTLMPNCKGLSREEISDFKQRGVIGLTEKKKTKIVENIIQTNNLDVENTEITGNALKLNYTDYGLFLELSQSSLDEIITQRIMLAVHVGETLHLEPGRAAFLLPVELPGITELESMLQTNATDAISLAIVDDEFVEVSLKGTWIATSENAERGTFMTVLAPETMALLYRLWRSAISVSISYI